MGIIFLPYSLFHAGSPRARLGRRLTAKGFPVPSSAPRSFRRTSANCTGSARGIHAGMRSNRRFGFREASPSASLRAGSGRAAPLCRTLSRRADSNPGGNGRGPRSDRGANDIRRPVLSDGMRRLLRQRKTFNGRLQARPTTFREWPLSPSSFLNPSSG